jgi:hypothetical protein
MVVNLKGINVGNHILWIKSWWINIHITVKLSQIQLGLSCKLVSFWLLDIFKEVDFWVRDVWREIPALRKMLRIFYMQYLALSKTGEFDSYSGM